MDCELHSFFIVAMQKKKPVIECNISYGSFTVESESIGMGNVRIVHKVFLTRPTVKHTRSSAGTDKSARRFYVRDGPVRSIRSRIPGPTSDI